MNGITRIKHQAGALLAATLLATTPLLANEEKGRWYPRTPDHSLWADGLEGAALMLANDSHALLLLRPDGEDALVNVTYPGALGQTELVSRLEMPDGSTRQLKISGDDLIRLPAPANGFVSYGFILDQIDFELLQAGLRWRLITQTEEMVFPLTGSRVAIDAALAQRAEEDS